MTIKSYDGKSIDVTCLGCADESGALDMSSDGQSLIVPRGLRPKIPRQWLSVALVICGDTGKPDQEHRSGR